MTTETRRATDQSIGRLLKDRRDGASKSEMYRKLNVSPGTYNMWEGNVYVPGDEFAEDLADHLGIEYKEMVWLLHRARVNSSVGVYLSSFQPTAA